MSLFTSQKQHHLNFNEIKYLFNFTNEDIIDANDYQHDDDETNFS